MAQPTTLVLANTDLVDRRPLGMGLKSPLVTDPRTGDFARIEGEENVRECIRDLITTRIGERVMNENFGTVIPTVLFEDRDGLLDALPFQVQEAIRRFEPRVTNVVAKAQPDGETGVLLHISWTIRTTGQTGSLVHPFLTEKSTNG